jgi:UDP-glucose 4-epimerase
MHSVGVLDCFRYGPERMQASCWGRPVLYKVDITDRQSTARAFADFHPDAVIHLAAVHYIPECEGDPTTAVETNVVGTINVMLAAPRGCRVVFASSGAVYAPDVHPHHESGSPVVPSDVYGLSKLQAEQYVRYFAEKRDIAAVTVRLFNVVGPGETNPHLVPEMVGQVRAGRREVAVGNLWPRRSYLHVKDAAAGFASAALRGDVAPGAAVIVNLGTRHAHSVSEIAEKLAQISGRSFALRQDPSRIRPVDRPVLAADHTRMTALFGWRPRLGLDKALADIWRDPDVARVPHERFRA